MPKRSPWNVELMDSDRLGKGWSFSDVAAEAGVSVASVTRFFNGTHRAPGMAKKIALALGRDVDRYLIRLSGMMNRDGVASDPGPVDERLQPPLPFVRRKAVDAR